VIINVLLCRINALASFIDINRKDML